MTTNAPLLHHVEAGHGPTLLCIHGFPHDHTLWQPQLEELTDVARVIAPDLRGFGASGGPDATMTMRAYATDLRNLLRHLDAAPAVVMGLSMGGYIALAFASLFPDALRALVLCNTRATADTPEAAAARLASARRVETEGPGAVVPGMVEGMTSAASRARDKTLNDRVGAMMLRQPGAGVAAALRGMAERPDRAVGLPAIKARTLVITGSDDTLIPPAETAAIAEAIPHARLVTIPGAGHLTPLENPVQFNAAVRSFLTRLPG